jgi:tRNA threonylcarbamoyladenosine biosynthesis protein TsaE
MEFSVSLQGLSAFARTFWNTVSGASVVAFHGPMGAGKTTIIMALCREKGVEDTMGSPSFSIINEYAYGKEDPAKKIYHIDLYRLKDEEEVVQAGVEDCLYSGSICLVEWPEKAPHLFDEETVHVFIRPVSENERTIEISLPAGLSAHIKEQS